MNDQTLTVFELSIIIKVVITILFSWFNIEDLSKKQFYKVV